MITLKVRARKGDLISSVKIFRIKYQIHYTDVKKKNKKQKNKKGKADYLGYQGGFSSSSLAEIDLKWTMMVELSIVDDEDNL